MICYGVTNGIAAIITGSVVKLTGRCPVVAFATILHVGIIITLLMWKPDTSNKYVYFLMSGLWGVADAVWLVQINGEFFIRTYNDKNTDLLLRENRGKNMKRNVRYLQWHCCELYLLREMN